MTTTHPGGVPASCTLPTAEQSLRLAELDDLFTGHVDHVRRDGSTGVLALDGSPDTAAPAARLAARETQCCSFFAFDLAIADGATTLTITADGHADVLAALEDRAQAIAGTAR